MLTLLNLQFYLLMVDVRGLLDIDLSSSPFFRVVRPEPPFIFGASEVFCPRSGFKLCPSDFLAQTPV